MSCNAPSKMTGTDDNIGFDRALMAHQESMSTTTETLHPGKLISWAKKKGSSKNWIYSQTMNKILERLAALKTFDATNSIFDDLSQNGSTASTINCTIITPQTIIPQPAKTIGRSRIHTRLVPHTIAIVNNTNHQLNEKARTTRLAPLLKPFCLSPIFYCIFQISNLSFWYLLIFT
ncbi:MAG: hypothetical protein HJJLKODD_00829 [Phycisphaerae bacterium]|nr:hypothetical protein [Phycisphaerae bacterium]